MTIHKDFSSFFGAPVKNNLSNFFGVPIQPVSTPAISILTSPSSSLSHFERKLEQRFVNKKSNPELRKTSNQSKKWRGKTHEKKLKERYRDPSYVFNLLHTSHLQVYDSGGRPICHGNCKFNCQAKFRYDAPLLQEQLNLWWGDDSDNVKRDVLLCDDLKDWSVQKEDGTHELRWFISNREVCRNFYLRARGMHHSHVLKLQNEFLHKKRTHLSAVFDRYEQKDSKPSPKRDELVAWLKLFKKHVGGEPMPNEDVTILPYRNKISIFEEYQSDLESVGCPVGGTPAKSAYFYEVFDEESVRLKIRLQRDTGTMKKCSICDVYSTQLRSAKTWEERMQIKEWRRKHLEKQRLQRQKYYLHRKKSVGRGRKRYLSIIIDGMDQKKTDIPVMASTTKDDPPLTQRVIGVKVHGLRNYCFIVDDNLPGGANLICEVLRRVLLDLDARNELPTEKPTLYLQIDNCGENKNKTLFGFLTHLVKKNIFHKIKAGFLMVGHTHEDIDQMFSVIATFLKRESVICPDRQSLFQAIKDAFADESQKPEVFSLSCLDVFDYTKYYADYLDPDLHHYQEPHQFRIKIFTNSNNEDVVLVHYKNWCNSKYWQPCNPPTTAAGPSNISSLPTVQDSDSPQTKKIRVRKDQRGKSTLGQRAAKQRIKLKLGAVTQPNKTNSAVPENFSDSEEDVVIATDRLSTIRDQNVPGILWLVKEPQLQNVPMITFTEAEVLAKLKKCQKVFNILKTSYFPQNPQVFNHQIIANWQNWLTQQEETYQISNFGKLSYLLFPRDSKTRKPASTTELENNLQDAAPGDPNDELEFVTHSSGPHGQFSKEDRQTFVRDILLEEESNPNAEILINMGCIYKYEYGGKTNIMVGLVKKIIFDDSTNLVSSVEVLQCPPKGAKRDNLYIDISENDAFNMDYRIRVTDVLERSMLLAYNLQMTSTGHFCKKRKGGKYGHSSHFLAKTRIQSFYSMIATSNKFLSWSQRLLCRRLSSILKKIKGGHALCT